MNFTYKSFIVLNMLNNLESNSKIECIISYAGQRRKQLLSEFHIGMTRNICIKFINSQVTLSKRGQHFDTITFATAEFDNIAFYKF